MVMVMNVEHFLKFGRFFVDSLSNWKYIIGSFLAISEVILAISDVGLDNILNFCKKFAKNILKDAFG